MTAWPFCVRLHLRFQLNSETVVKKIHARLRLHYSNLNYMYKKIHLQEIQTCDNVYNPNKMKYKLLKGINIL